MQAASRLRCDPTDYARKQQEKKDRAKELRDQRQRGVFSEDHTFEPKVNPRSKGQAPSSREEDERPTADAMRRGSSTSYDDMPIRQSKSLAAGRKEILNPEEAPIRKKTTAMGNSRPNNNDDHWGGDQDSDALDNLSRKYPKKQAGRQPEQTPPHSPAPLEPQHDSLYREVKRATGHDLDDVPIKKLNAAATANVVKHTGPCLRNSSCACPKCGGGGGGGSIPASNTRADPPPPVRRREMRPEANTNSYESKSQSARDGYGGQSGMESSLTLLKSKMSRQKARSAPSNQASLYLDQPSRSEPQMSSGRQSGGYNTGYASSSSSSAAPRRAPQPATNPPSSSNVRASQAQPSSSSRMQSGRQTEDRPAVAAARRLPRHQEVDEEDEAPPSRYPAPISSGFQNGDAPDEYPDEMEEMEECGNCHRRFNITSLAKHQKICEKVFTGQRKVYDMSAKRLEGTEAEKLIKQSKRGKKASASAAAEDKPIKAKAVDWKQQSNAFRDAMRANREINKAIKEGRPPPAMVPSAPDPSLIPCDFCGRRFNDKAAERHIPFCKEKAQRSGGGGAGGAKGPAAKKPAPAPAAPTRAPPRKR
ncbi:hypothetical protein Poli38472_004159 [Pythium oligandrum]|uniref:C2HC/C3H-type domain-containing protein n=1 Tax=Pythium oligandrum TaxID=41045 RepID=A0A8K1CNL1_PYTOL|nr:hypothetical protein Poli38472_004159 [Pythium oligandrum]|eukprot:TMW66394.1 hypothetical protein Poli38472_004159 [Pythium oligandrum]